MRASSFVDDWKSFLRRTTVDSKGRELVASLRMTSINSML